MAIRSCYLAQNILQIHSDPLVLPGVVVSLKATPQPCWDKCDFTVSSGLL